MKYYISIFAILLFFSCQQPLDFSNSQFYDIEEILTSVNCDEDCEEMADCEGQTVKMIGTIDEANINSATYNFFMTDRSNAQVDIEVRVDTSMSAEIFSFLAGKGGFDARIISELGGEDGSGSNCKREIFMTVDEVADIDIIE